jgi:hypothetical protein
VRKIREGFAIRHTDANLHDFIDRTHGRFPFAAKTPRQKDHRSIIRLVQPFGGAGWMAVWPERQRF